MKIGKVEPLVFAVLAVSAVVRAAVFRSNRIDFFANLSGKLGGGNGATK